MTVQQELQFRWRPGADGGAGEVGVVDPATSSDARVQVVSVEAARRWAVHRAAETGDGRVINDLEQLLAQHGVEARPAPAVSSSVEEEAPMPPKKIPTSPVNVLHPEWRMGGGFALRGGRSLTRKPVSLKEIAGLIFYLRQVGEVAEAERIRAETKRLCAIARDLGYGRLDRPKGARLDERMGVSPGAARDATEGP